MTSARKVTHRKRLTTEDVLRYRPHAVSRTTVRRHYALWRARQGLPQRCDVPSCQFHAEEMHWCGKPLLPILDHINGNNLDNNPGNLRYLCPNCNSQLSTHGGRNRGRVLSAVAGKYELRPRDDGQNVHIHVFATPGKFRYAGNRAKKGSGRKVPDE
jgi:hypothetical protein